MTNIVTNMSTDALPSVSAQPVFAGSFLEQERPKALFPADAFGAARAKLAIVFSYEHVELIALDFVLVLIKSMRRRARDHTARAIERTTVTRTAEFFGLILPSHGAAQVRAGGFVADDLVRRVARSSRAATLPANRCRS